LHLALANGTADLDMCHSENPSMAQFARVQMLTPNGTRVWAENVYAARSTPLRFWRSGVTNKTFAVEWKIYVPPPIGIWVHAAPVRDDQEVVIGNTSNWSAFSFYDGATVLTRLSEGHGGGGGADIEGVGERSAVIGFGITEVFNFTSAANASAFVAPDAFDALLRGPIPVARGLVVARALARALAH
jgi:hypothetical protein